MARIFFAFEGLGNYDLNHLKIMGGVSILNFLRRSIVMVTPDQIQPGKSDMSEPRDYILYFDWYQAVTAVIRFRELRLDEPFLMGSARKYNTFVVVGHSLGGGAAWEFSNRLRDNYGHMTNFGMTLDARNNHAITGEEAGSAPWKKPGWTFPAAMHWVNYYQRTDWGFKGFALPNLAPGDNVLVDRNDVPDISHNRLLSYDSSNIRPSGEQKIPATLRMFNEISSPSVGYFQDVIPT